MAASSSDEETVQCSGCPNRFILSVGISTDGRTICEFCRRQRLIEELQKSDKACKNTIVCPNPKCKAVVQQACMNKHILMCMFSHFACPNSNCDFRGTKPETDAHAGSCEHRRVTCPDCGKGLSMKEIEQHKQECGAQVKCEQCGTIVSNSSKKTHDAWLCPRRAMRAFCRDCKKVFSHVDLQRHRDTCTDGQIQEEERPPEPILLARQHTPMLLYDRRTELPEYNNDTDNSKTKRRNHSAPTDDNAVVRLQETPNTTVTAMPIPHEVLRSSLSVPGYSVEPLMRSSIGVYRKPVQVSPTARTRWRMLMDVIDSNMEDYRQQLRQAQEQLPKPSRTASV